MTNLRQLVRAANSAKAAKTFNWYPGHMFSGMKAMVGKLNTVDCIIEVHDARLPLTGRNQEFKRHLGTIKPRLLVLNKCDLADLNKFSDVKQKLIQNGDNHFMLTDLTGNRMRDSQTGYTNLLERILDLINKSDRFNRISSYEFKLMVVGIPNVGKSTLINRLRQHHLGRKGEATKTGASAGVTRHVEYKIKICSRPLIYILDTPGVLEPGSMDSFDQAMRLALCATVSEKVVDGVKLCDYLINYLHENDNTSYMVHYDLDRPVSSIRELAEHCSKLKSSGQDITCGLKNTNDINVVAWNFIKHFRRGLYGKVMFD